MSDTVSNPFEAAVFVHARAVGGYDDLQKVMLAFVDQSGRTPKELREEMQKSGSRGNLIYRAWKRYFDAKTASKKFGFIGVGCLTFADARLAKFCKRVNLTF